MGIADIFSLQFYFRLKALNSLPTVILPGQHCQVNNWCMLTFLDIY